MFARDRQSFPFIEQWQRVHRSLTRLQKAHDSNADADEVMDLFYSLFQNIFAMRDWLLNSNVDSLKVKALFSTNRLKLCRDITNGTKHCTLRRPSVDGAFMTVREYEPCSRGTARDDAFRLLADGRKIDMYDLALLCIADLKQFMATEGLLAVQTSLLAHGMRNP